MAIVELDPRDPTPIYAQLERALRAAIATGRLKPGDQLPTVRQMAVDLRVNANTIARVYLDLERAGVLETRRGVGSFVKASPAEVRSAGERQRLLRAVAVRAAADAATQGFTVRELIRQLDTLRKEGA